MTRARRNRLAALIGVAIGAWIAVLLLVVPA